MSGKNNNVIFCCNYSSPSYETLRAKLDLVRFDATPASRLTWAGKPKVEDAEKLASQLIFNLMKTSKAVYVY